MRINDTSLSVRAKNALHKKGFQTSGQCVDLTEEKLFSIPFLGKKTVKEILKYFESDEFEKGLSNETSNIFSDGCEERFQYLVNILAIPLLDLPLSVRAENVLKKLKVEFLKDLVPLDYIAILNVRDCGKKTLREIKTFLKKIELNLEMDLSADLKKEIAVQIENSEQPGLTIKNCKIKYPTIAVVFESLLNNIFPKHKFTFYKKCYELYQQNGTLESVAKIVGVTRERVRQILVKGDKLGMFKYGGREYSFVEKEKILIDYKKYLNLSQTAKHNKISLEYLKRLLAAYNITDKILYSIKIDSKKNECIKDYEKIKNELGHHPTTTELCKKTKWRTFSARVQRLWGTFEVFRKDMSIPKPVRVFPEATKRFIEKRKRISLIIKMQNLDQIREKLVQCKPLSSLEISQKCNIKQSKVYNLLTMLMTTGEVARVGQGSNVKYRLR